VVGGGPVALIMSHDHGAHEVDYPVVVLLVLTIAAGLFHSVPKALASVRRLRPDMNALVLVSVIGAIFLEEWAEAGVLAFLYGLSGVVENWSTRRARSVSPRVATKRSRVNSQRVGSSAGQPSSSWAMPT